MDLMEHPSPDSVTAREIAKQAGLQHSLIFRHFGSMDQLVLAVAARYSVDYVDQVADRGDVFDGFDRALDFMLGGKSEVGMMARILMASDDLPRRGAYPGMAVHATQIEQTLAAGGDPSTAGLTGQPPRDPWVVTVFALALISGWTLVEDWALGAEALEAVGRDELRRQLHQVVRSMVAREAGLGDPAAVGSCISEHKA